jgi:hypothetical protein
MEETPPKLFVNYIKKYCPLFARKVKGHTKNASNTVSIFKSENSSCTFIVVHIILLFEVDFTDCNHFSSMKGI